MLNGNHHEADNLELIDGIGPKRAKWLRQTLNVHTLHELAALILDAHEAQLKDDKSAPSRRDLDAWISQAQALIAAPEISDTEAVTTPKNDGWRPAASFVVEFQVWHHEDGTQSRRTRVSHMEADVSETWSGINQANLCEWMVKQFGEEIGNDPVMEVAPMQAGAAPVQIKMIQLQAFQPEPSPMLLGAAQPGQPFLGYLKGDEPFAMRALLELPAGVNLETATYSAQFYAKSLATGTITYLGNTQSTPISGLQAPYPAWLPEARLKTGLYRLNIETVIEGDAATTSYFEIPFVEVL